MNLPRFLLAVVVLLGMPWTSANGDQTSYLSIELELERQLLSEDLRLWGQARQEQNDGLLEFARTLAALDQAVELREVAVEDLERLEKDIQVAKERLNAANARAAAHRLQVLQRLRRTSLLEFRLESISRGGDLQLDPLSGAWDLTLDPGKRAGILQLRFLNNTVTGTYRMDDGVSGSLNGSYEGGELRLERVDEKAGRDALWEGTLDPATRSIRGNWTALDEETAGPASGAWSAQRKVLTP